MKREWLPIVLATAIFAALSLTAAITSPGFLEADACTHYQYARFALGEEHYLVNVWGRPFATALYAIPATLAGRMGVRVTSLICALLIATIAWRIARDQNYRWPALAFIFTLAQPLLFLHSFSELTELPFALLLVMAFWAYRRRQFLVMTILAALTPTARPEGFGILLLALLALIAHRRWWWIVLLPVPLLIWDYAGWRIYGRPEYAGVPPSLNWLMWIRHEWPYAQKSAYAAGSLFHFVALLPALVGPLVFPFMMIGVWRSLRWEDEAPAELRSVTSRKSGSAGASPSRFQFLIAAIPLCILAVHSLLYWLGRMASNGELRYLLIVAPFWALLAAKGWEWTFDRFGWRRPVLWAGVAALLPAAANFYYQVLPLRLTVDGYTARAVAHWYRDGDIHRDYPRLLASNPEIAFFMGVSHTDRGWMREWRKEIVAKAQPGTVLIWDPVYGLYNADAQRIVTPDEILSAGWIEHPEIADQFNQSGDGPEWRVFFSPISIFGKRSD